MVTASGMLLDQPGSNGLTCEGFDPGGRDKGVYLALFGGDCNYGEFEVKRYTGPGLDLFNPSSRWPDGSATALPLELFLVR